MSEITLTIDGQEVKAQQGDTVLEAADRAGIRIPTLCAHPALEPYGACRLCIVNIEGMRGNPTSCTTPATDGMVVNTKTDEIIDTRREILKLMLSGHTSPCLVCYHRDLCEKYRPRPFKTGKATRCTFCSNRDSCELRELAFEYNIDEFDMPIIYKNMEIERDDPFMDRDYNLCVLCGRCARICKKIHGKSAIDFQNRGKDARVGTAFDKLHAETNCKFCGACIDICPTGTLADRFAKWQGAPDSEDRTTCILCPHGCSLKLELQGGKAIAAGMTEPTREARICGVGRFATAQLLDNPQRRMSPMIRVDDGLIKTDLEEALEFAAEKLKAFSGADFAAIAHEQATREELYILKKFTTDVMKSDNFIIAKPDGEPVDTGAAKAVFTTGAFITGDAAEKLDALVVADLYDSDAKLAADAFLPAAALTEVGGTFLNADGEIKELAPAAKPPRGQIADWQLACALAKKLGTDGFDFASVSDITKELEAEKFEVAQPAAPDPSPLDDVDALPKYYRGHKMSGIVCALSAIGTQPETADEEPAGAEAEAGGDDRPFKIIEKVEIVPNTYMTKVHAPEIAKTCRAGQFVIAMANEKSERIPYTISDFDPEEGTVTLVTLEVGRSSRELAKLRAGDHLAHFAGPLGEPVEVKNYGTVVCAGGCYGVGAILPIARAMKDAGNRVICIEEASSHYLLHWQDKLEEVSDELVIVTKDGSAGMKGGIQEAIQMLDGRGEKIDQAYIIGCTFMMMLVSDVTKELSIPTQTAMNPLMLDGTGMCGACRVSLGDETKFACVDGPFLDGHKINWLEIVQRQASFKKEEVEALPQEAARHAHGHECKCGAH